MTNLDVSCLCGKVKTSVHLSKASSDRLTICHRSQCRYNLGALCHAALPIKDRPDGLLLEQLSSFEPQPSCRRYFCPTCGSHIFENDNGWKVQSGVVDGIHNEQVFDTLERMVDHTYVHETIDGGLSACLTGSEPRVAEHILQTDASSSLTEAKHVSDSASTNIALEEDHARLQASCLCGGVEFYLTRPNTTSRLCSSPWPDLIIPYCSRSPENPEDVKWWIVEDHKWLAGTCACRSCRLGLGFPIQAWTFVSKSNLIKSDGSAFSYDLGLLQSFESSPGAIREFCRGCGATVFWHSAVRPGVVDVSVGLLRASEGVLARSWLQWWTERISFAEEAFERQLVTVLEPQLSKILDIAS